MTPFSLFLKIAICRSLSRYFRIENGFLIFILRFSKVNDEFYRPYSGWTASVYTGPFTSADLPKLDLMVDKLQMMVDEDLVAVTTWWTDFKAWLAAENKNWTYMEESNFRSDLADFLHSVRGARFSRDFRFNGSLDCNQAAPPLIASRLPCPEKQSKI